MKNKCINFLKDFNKSSFNYKLFFIIKSLIFLFFLFLLKVPVILIRELALDLILEIFKLNIVIKIFYWLFEVLYYLIILVAIKKLISEE